MITVSRLLWVADYWYFCYNQKRLKHYMQKKKVTLLCTSVRSLKINYCRDETNAQLIPRGILSF